MYKRQFQVAPSSWEPNASPARATQNMLCGALGLFLMAIIVLLEFTPLPTVSKDRNRSRLLNTAPLSLIAAAPIDTYRTLGM